MCVRNMHKIQNKTRRNSRFRATRGDEKGDAAQLLRLSFIPLSFSPHPIPQVSCSTLRSNHGRLGRAAPRQGKGCAHGAQSESWRIPSRKWPVRTLFSHVFRDAARVFKPLFYRPHSPVTQQRRYPPVAFFSVGEMKGTNRVNA